MIATLVIDSLACLVNTAQMMRSHLIKLKNTRNLRRASVPFILCTLFFASESAWSSTVEDLQRKLRANQAYLEGDYAVALRDWTLLTDGGDKDSPYYLGVMYSKGEGVAKDEQKAVKFFRIGADRGNDAAQNALAVYFEAGSGGLQLNKSKAAYWYRKSADQGNPLAQVSLGIMHAKGEGVLQDYEAALSLFRAAAAQENVDALFNLGVMAANGYGTDRNFVVAHMWANLAASHGGHEDAEQLRETLSGVMRPQEILQAQRLAKQCLIQRYKGCDEQ